MWTVNYLRLNVGAFAGDDLLEVDACCALFLSSTNFTILCM